MLAFLAGLVAGTIVAAVAMRRRTSALRDAAERDPLTGLLNRRGLAAWASRLAAAEVTVLAFDLDNLRELNRAGHGVGDDALRRTADALSAQLRAGQAAARVGGDEFVFMATTAPPGMPERVFQAVRASVGGVSAGCVTGPAGRLEDLLEQADQALLTAKGRGGGVLVVEPGLEPLGE